MIWNDKLQPNLGLLLQLNSNIAWRLNGGTLFGTIIGIKQSESADDLDITVVPYEDWDKSDKFWYKCNRRVFIRSSHSSKIKGSNIINSCRMFPFKDKVGSNVYILHVAGETETPLHYFGLLKSKYVSHRFNSQKT